MKARITIAIVLLFATLPVSWSQQAGANASLQQRVAELKQAMAANRAKLMKYQWIQSTEVSVKGKIRKDQQMACHYGPDGKVVKTVIGVDPAQQQSAQGGIRGRVIAKKKEEMQDYTERLKSLISHYAPPDPQMIREAKEAGNAGLTASNGIAILTFTDYYKPGDKVSVGFDTAAKKLVSYDVNTYLDDPKNDVVTLTNRFDSLPDGTNYVQQTVLDAQSKQIRITTTNSNYTRIVQ